MLVLVHSRFCLHAADAHFCRKAVLLLWHVACRRMLLPLPNLLCGVAVLLPDQSQGLTDLDQLC